MHNFNKLQIEKIISFAFEAGEIAREAFLTKNFEVKIKADGSKVTSADIAVSKFIGRKLAQEFPQIPVICEEGESHEIAAETFFLIDPIDGTSSFISGNEEFSINIGLVKNRKAVFGLIYAPLFEDGKMAFCDEENKVKILKQVQDGRREYVCHPELVSGSSPLRIITSSRSKDIDIENCISQIRPEFLENYKVEKLASAIKFFRILENDADLYLHFRPSMEWDTVAGSALVELMGGKVKNLFFNQGKFSIGESLIYKKSDFKNQPFIAKL